ncbi:MAG: GNAT family protein [Chitinophagaceae bacterium]
MSRPFRFSEAYCLENDIALLRPLAISDYASLLPFSENEPELWRFNAGGADNARNLERYMLHALKRREEQTEYPFIVIDKRSGKVAGCTRYYDFHPERKTVQIGYTWYGKTFQGTGLNRSCKYLLLDFAFSDLKIERVGFGANAANERSINAMKSIGCTVEGVLRSNSVDAAGNRIDNIVLSILRSEWEQKIRPGWGKWENA